MRNGWIDTSLDDVCQFKGGTGFKEHLQGKKSGLYPFIKVSDMALEGNEKFIVNSNNWIDESDIKEMGVNLMPEGSVVFAKVGAALKLNKRRILTRLTAIDNNMMAAIPDIKKIDTEYLYYFMLTQDLGRFCQESAVPSVNQQHMSEILIPLPPLDEQKKIAAILRTWDDAVEKQEEIIKKKYKNYKSLVLSVFEGLIKNKKNLITAEEVFEPVTEKKRSDLPLLAVTQDQGVLPRDQLDRRVVMPEGSIDGYKVVRKGDFVISLRSFEGGLEYSEYTGLISPAYTILRPKIEIDASFYRFYFKSYSFVGRLSPLVFGIRDGKSIAFRDFGFMEIPNPTLNDQKKISRALLCFEQEMEIQKRYLETLKNQKRGLMQKLLTGTWPVQADSSEESSNKKEKKHA